MSGNTFGIPTAATISVTESGSSLTPVSSADSPRQTERKSGTTKKKPALDEELEEEHRQPAGQLPVLQHREADERLSAPVGDACLPAEEDPDHE